MHPVTPAPKHDPYAALRSPAYRAYAAGAVCANLGTQMTNVALGWDIVQRTGSKSLEEQAMLLGWVGLVQAIPVIVLALPAGQIADRFDRRKIIVFTQIIGAIMSLSLAFMAIHPLSRPFTDSIAGALGQPVLRVELGLMYVIMFIGATAYALGGPSRSSMLPQLIPTSIFANAVAWNSTFFHISSVVGPALAGLVIWKMNVAAVYIADGAMTMVFVFALIGLKIAAVERKREPTTLRTLTEGIRFVYNNKIIFATITLDMFAVLLGGAVYLLPLFAKELGVSAQGFGWLRAAPAIGAIGMAMLITHLPPMKKAGRAMLWAVAGFGVATIVFGLTPVLRDWVLKHHPESILAGRFLGAHLWYWVALIALLLTGAFDNISVVVRHTLVQVMAPDSMRGRISAVNSVFIGASNELGGFESGLTARLFGHVNAVVLGGIGTIVVVIATTLKWPQLRSFGSLHSVKAADEPGPPPAAFEPVMKPAKQPE
jgi:MFS family permease